MVAIRVSPVKAVMMTQVSLVLAEVVHRVSPSQVKEVVSCPLCLSTMKNILAINSESPCVGHFCVVARMGIAYGVSDNHDGLGSGQAAVRPRWRPHPATEGKGRYTTFSLNAAEQLCPCSKTTIADAHHRRSGKVITAVEQNATTIMKSGGQPGRPWLCSRRRRWMQLCWSWLHPHIHNCVRRQTWIYQSKPFSI